MGGKPPTVMGPIVLETLTAMVNVKVKVNVKVNVNVNVKVNVKVYIIPFVLHHFHWIFIGFSLDFHWIPEKK